MFRKFLMYLLVITFSLFVFGCQTGPQQIQTNPPMVNFYASPIEVLSGEHVTLHWNVQNADQVTINQGTGEIIDLEGSMTVTPTETTEYTLITTNESDTSIITITVTVN